MVTTISSPSATITPDVIAAAKAQFVEAKVCESLTQAMLDITAGDLEADSIDYTMSRAYASEEDAIASFLEADDDGSGLVDLDELLQFLPDGTDRDAARELMIKYDDDGNRQLDQGEFMNLVQNISPCEMHGESALVLLMTMCECEDIGAEGVLKMGAQRNTIEAIQNVALKYGAYNSTIKELAPKLISLLSNELGGDFELASALDQCVAVIPDGVAFHKLKTEKGKAYYVSTSTGQTTWDEPPEYSAMMMACESVAEYASTISGASTQVRALTENKHLLLLHTTVSFPRVFPHVFPL